MANYPESETGSLQSSSGTVYAIDEKRGLLGLLFIAKFTEKQHGKSRGSDPK